MRHGWILNVTIRGVPTEHPGWWWELFGRQAVALGCVSISLGLFAHVHWFWSNNKTLERFCELGKVTTLVALIISLAWWIYEVS
jgi:hypothetical protein